MKHPLSRVRVILEAADGRPLGSAVVDADVTARPELEPVTGYDDGDLSGADVEDARRMLEAAITTARDAAVAWRPL